MWLFWHQWFGLNISYSFVQTQRKTAKVAVVVCFWFIFIFIFIYVYSLGGGGGAAFENILKRFHFWSLVVYCTHWMDHGLC